MKISPMASIATDLNGKTNKKQVAFHMNFDKVCAILTYLRILYQGDIWMNPKCSSISGDKKSLPS
ncbi:MAG: hypothetical protein SWC96_09920, partial [Thermodesulfobacteriota bacterium]|nr:hypothetical protein [Thermodesulfobacteriota bacterium]